MPGSHACQLRSIYHRGERQNLLILVSITTKVNHISSSQ